MIRPPYLWAARAAGAEPWFPVDIDGELAMGVTEPDVDDHAGEFGVGRFGPVPAVMR